MYPTAAACGGVVTPLYEFPVPAWLSRYAERPIAGTFYYGEKDRSLSEHTYPGGGNMGIRRTAIERYRMFNPELGRTGNSPMGGEEKDLFARRCGPEGKRSTMCRVQSSITSSRNKADARNISTGSPA